MSELCKKCKKLLKPNRADAEKGPALPRPVPAASGSATAAALGAGHGRSRSRARPAITREAAPAAGEFRAIRFDKLLRFKQVYTFNGRRTR